MQNRLSCRSYSNPRQNEKCYQRLNLLHTMFKYEAPFLRVCLRHLNSNTACGKKQFFTKRTAGPVAIATIVNPALHASRFKSIDNVVVCA